MKKIKYEGKDIKLPFPVGLPEDPTAMSSVANRFTGEQAALPEFAVAVYDVIMGSEQLATNHDRQVGEGGSPHWETMLSETIHDAARLAAPRMGVTSSHPSLKIGRAPPSSA